MTSADEASKKQPNTNAQAPAKKRINLAFQGGGSHGAFTWGVMDRLLEEERLDFEGISGTSAGAMNALVMASGLGAGGREAARERLERFWLGVGEYAPFSPVRRNPWDVLRGNFGYDHSWSYRMFTSFTHMVSPYQWNPLNFNPLRALIRKHIDFDAACHRSNLKLFVSTTCVETGRIRIFKNDELKEDMLLASTALPALFQAVKIGDRHYWDGGFCGNPALFPLFYECESTDLLIVQINPLYREEVPVTTFEIQDRASEISFNGSLANEIRAIQFVTRLIEKGALDPARYRKVNIHLVESEAEMSKLSPSTKFMTEPKFLRHLRDLGREAADRWLKAHFDDIGVQSSVDIKEKYLQDSITRSNPL